MMKITVYTKVGCPWCAGVMEFLDDKGIDYEEREVTGHREHFDEMVRLSGQKKAPVVVIDEEILADTDKEAVEKYLTDKGLLTP
jgi:glutaredoxin 3